MMVMVTMDSLMYALCIITHPHACAFDLIRIGRRRRYLPNCGTQTPWVHYVWSMASTLAMLYDRSVTEAVSIITITRLE